MALAQSRQAGQEHRAHPQGDHRRPTSELVHGPPTLPIVVAAMDYSAHDPDHPAGGDPWASSPQHNRTSFGQPSGSDIPSSPLPPQASPYGQDSDYGYMGGQVSQDRPGTASENGDTPQQRPPSSGQENQAPPQQESHRPQQPQQPPAHGQQQPQRYHGARPHRQQPHYKLQAKVTGLERTGKKDPILRFDVYVRWTYTLPDPKLNLSDKPSQVPHHPVSRCPASALRVRQARRASDIGLPRSHGPRRTTSLHRGRCWDRGG